MKKSTFKVILAPRALAALDQIEDPSIQKEVMKRIEGLGRKPDEWWEVKP